jgi:hypothetical protein
MRGLDEKIWKVLAPISRAHSTALEAPPAVPKCTPIRLIILVMGTVYKAGETGAEMPVNYAGNALVLVHNRGTPEPRLRLFAEYKRVTNTILGYER